MLKQLITIHIPREVSYIHTVALFGRVRLVI